MRRLILFGFINNLQYLFYKLGKTDIPSIILGGLSDVILILRVKPFKPAYKLILKLILIFLYL